MTISFLPKQFPIHAFQEALVSWFKLEQRDLPWRKDQDPYKVWVSEIMLQQTKVDTVIPYFYRFLDKFPTPESLANADEQEVLKAWEGLGYYSRARNLQSAVKEVMENYGGKVPNNPKELGNLKGVGPYTKGAILSIAFGQPEPAVDGNVMRVFSRIFKVEEDIAKPKTRKIHEDLVRSVISKEDPSAFNQGLMELGALICKPRNPDCLLCPVQEYCMAYEQGLEDILPIKTKAKSQRVEPYAALLIKNERNEVLVQKRPEKGLLANLYEFPMASLKDLDLTTIPNWFYGEYGLHIDIIQKETVVKHVFSHLTWELDAYSATVQSGKLDVGPATFCSLKDLELLPFPVSHQKLLPFVKTLLT
ncbi:A/G-specific adenine glycosylase [Salirhabdus euzebyi]|uniref:Adenine DNA glycosylase n=1 Tax=Salirhabdus euzebyi TaxID=394506 RepID=A0A841QA38_9BACI|nr:A/G-specific adenine glycosylase [Salirhabdus euzebyi]MBB6455092.1 A/G-specific adenine glycosylase [Salirhabdus euzebyi]